MDNNVSALMNLFASFPSLAGIPSDHGAATAPIGGLPALASMSAVSADAVNPVAAEFARLFTEHTANFWQRVIGQPVANTTAEEVQDLVEEPQAEIEAQQGPRISVKAEPVDLEEDIYPMSDLQADRALTLEHRAIRKAEKELKLLKLTWKRQQIQKEVAEWQQKTGQGVQAVNAPGPVRRRGRNATATTPSTSAPRQPATSSRQPAAASRQSAAASRQPAAARRAAAAAPRSRGRPTRGRRGAQAAGAQSG